jgi:hypothetical protein
MPQHSYSYYIQNSELLVEDFDTKTVVAVVAVAAAADVLEEEKKGSFY